MNQERLLNIILSPHITEKSTRIEEKHNQFMFRVMKDASKSEIKKAIEWLFKVEVESVQTSNLKGKKKIFKQKLGKRAESKRAYVRLSAGHKIDFVKG